MFIFPPLTVALIGAYGWRGSYLILGLLAIATVVGCSTFIVRDPEMIGLHPDGLPPHELEAMIQYLRDCRQRIGRWLKRRELRPSGC